MSQNTPAEQLYKLGMNLNERLDKLNVGILEAAARLHQLNANIAKANDSSGKLARGLNLLTGVAALAAVASAFAAVVSLLRH